MAKKTSLSIPSKIKELVDTYETHIEAYRSQQYNETQLRREFLDPFFIALGWDVTNSAGYALWSHKDMFILRRGIRCFLDIPKYVVTTIEKE